MCPAVKKQLLNLYAAFGFIPTKSIALPGYTPEPPEVGSSSPILEDAVRDTNVTVVDSAGEEVTMSVAAFIDYLYNAQQPTGGGSSISISETPIADGEALKELTVIDGEGTTKTVPVSEQKDGQVYIYIDDDGRNFALVVLGENYSNIGSASLASKLDSSAAAPEFSTSSTYAVDEHCTYNGKIYRCTTAVTTAGAWDASKWTADTVALKPTNPTAGHLASLTATGDLADSGKGAADFMAADAKIQRIYNESGTDALDDKGQLFKSSLQGNYWMVGSHKYTYAGYSESVYKWQYQDNFNEIRYNPSNGEIIERYNSGYWNERERGTVTSGLNPANGDTIPSLPGVTFRYATGATFTPLATTMETTPYAHFSLESLPDRTWAAGIWAVGDLVKYDGKAYRCKAAATLSDTTAPSSDTTHWTEIPVLGQKEDASNKVTSLTAQSTDTQYPSAKCVYDALQGVDVKPTRIYNESGTDALDDKGGLYTSVVAQSYWTFKTYTLTYRGYYAVSGSTTTHNWYADSQSTSTISYDPVSGVVYNYYRQNFVWSRNELATQATGLDPRNGDVLDDMPSKYIEDYGSGSAAFHKTQMSMSDSPYSHLAVESVPTRTIAASTAYAVGDLLGDSGKAYRCISDYTSAATPVAPSADTTHWTEIPVLSQAFDLLDGLEVALHTINNGAQS